MNVGTIAGGTSVNTIPESASATLDFRSTDVRELVRMEVALHRLSKTRSTGQTPTRPAL